VSKMRNAQCIPNVDTDEGRRVEIPRSSLRSATARMVMSLRVVTSGDEILLFACNTLI